MTRVCRSKRSLLSPLGGATRVWLNGRGKLLGAFSEMIQGISRSLFSTRASQVAPAHCGVVLLKAEKRLRGSVISSLRMGMIARLPT